MNKLRFRRYGDYGVFDGVDTKMTPIEQDQLGVGESKARSISFILPEYITMTIDEALEIAEMITQHIGEESMSERKQRLPEQGKGERKAS